MKNWGIDMQLSWLPFSKGVIFVVLIETQVHSICISGSRQNSEILQLWCPFSKGVFCVVKMEKQENSTFALVV